MIETKELILRDFIEADIEKRIYWEQVETEWQLWDAPWEYDDLTEQEKQKELECYVENMRKWAEGYKQLPENKKRYTFQLVTNDEAQNYIGWVSAYCIDTEYNYTEQKGYCAVGIDIPEMSARGKGYAYIALCAFIKYLISYGEEEIFTQTWSGNERMLHMAEKIGFEECCRKKAFRQVRGRKYDGLTFKLNRKKFEGFCEEMRV